ncbi:MAG TPA: NAD(P)H-dependent oxidoreductase [Thermoleophilaceae bacterium]|jgi:chromate reductase
MRILAISGSLRIGSHNTALVRAARDLAPEGVEVELYDGLDSLPAFSEDRESVLPEPVQELNRRIREADALLVATPEYNGSAPGALKNALDWASRPHGEAALVAKPAAVIGASTTAYGARWAQEQIRRALTLSGAMVIDAELAVARADDKILAREVVDSATREGLRAVVAELAEAADAFAGGEALAA